MTTIAIYFVTQASLYVGVADGKIVQIQKGDRKSINPHAVVVDSFDATFNAIYADNERLYLNGFAIIDLIAWLYRENPTTVGSRLDKLFPNSLHYFDVLRAACQCASGQDRFAVGEADYDCSKVRDAHPAEFAELRDAWSQLYQRN